MGSIIVLSHHVLVGTVLGGSVVLEYAEGEFKAVNSDSAWQVITNIPVYNVPNEQLMNACWRYNLLYSGLQDQDGIVSWDEGMSLLEQVHINCPWSAIYDFNAEGIYIAIDNNYNDIAYTDLESFNFTIYVNINSPEINTTDIRLNQNYPNPFRDKTKIGFSLDEDSRIELFIFDGLGRKIKVLLDETIKAGQYSVIWDGKSETGEMLPSGVYWCSLKTRNRTETIQMILMGD